MTCSTVSHYLKSESFHVDCQDGWTSLSSVNGESQIKTYRISSAKWTQWVSNCTKQLKLGGEKSAEGARGELGGQELGECIRFKHILDRDES